MRSRAKRLNEPAHEVRGVPSQKRSKLTVENIKQATLELARRDGFSDLTTNRIAEHAGISIGTLYQYFSTVQSILICIFEDTSVEFAEATKSLMVSVLNAPINVAVPTVIDRLIRMHDKYREVLLRLPADMPELKLTERPMAFDNLVRGGIQAYLEWHFPDSAKRDIGRKVFFLEQIELGCIRRFLLSKPSQISRREFIDDLSRIVVPYIEQLK